MLLEQNWLPPGHKSFLCNICQRADTSPSKWTDSSKWDLLPGLPLRSTESRPWRRNETTPFSSAAQPVKT